MVFYSVIYPEIYNFGLNNPFLGGPGPVGIIYLTSKMVNLAKESFIICKSRGNLDDYVVEIDLFHDLSKKNTILGPNFSTMGLMGSYFRPKSPK